MKDFSSFCEGDIEPTLNKPIRVLIVSSEKYIVYLDDELYVEWSTVHRTPRRFGDIANEIGHLETVALGRLRDDQRLPFERLLGEAMARLIGDKDIAESREILAHAAAYLNARSIENARAWHVGAAVITTGVAALVLAIAFIFRTPLTDFLGEPTVTIVAASLLGSFGALLSILSRVRNLDINPASGTFIHRFEGACRIGAGVLGALLVALGVRGNLTFSFANQKADAFALLAVCFVSGASERIVPSFISQIEGRMKGGKKKEKKKKGKKRRTSEYESDAV